ncbi:MAG: hypothetical protein ACK4UJ_10020 [Leptonema sp. (in: bacteria)]
MEEASFNLWKTIRSQILNIVYNKDLECLFKTPNGLSNNLIWLFGHIALVREMLILKLSIQKINFPEILIDMFIKGSSPKNWKWDQDKIVLANGSRLTKIELWKTLLDFEEKEFVFLLNFLQERFKNYSIQIESPYQTSIGFVIDNLYKSLEYNIVHESIHLGQMQLYHKLC